jgi:hypothetical protein
MRLAPGGEGARSQLGLMAGGSVADLPTIGSASCGLGSRRPGELVRRVQLSPIGKKLFAANIRVSLICCAYFLTLVFLVLRLKSGTDFNNWEGLL